MPQDLYIYTKAQSPRSALVRSFSDLTPMEMFDLVLFDGKPFNIWLLDGASSYDADSGSLSYSCKFGIGSPGGVPTSGTYTLTSGANTTASLAYNSTYQQVEDALNALASITAEGGLDISSDSEFPNYEATWRTVGAKGLLSGDNTLLYPRSFVGVKRLITGDVSTKEIQLVMLRKRPMAYLSSATQVTNGWTGTIALNGMMLTHLLSTQLYDDTLLFEVGLWPTTGNPLRVLQIPIRILNSVLQEGAVSDTLIDSHCTIEEVAALFIPKDAYYLPVYCPADGKWRGLQGTQNDIGEWEPGLGQSQL